MSTQETAALVQSVNKMTETVAGKMGEIDQRMSLAESEFKEFRGERDVFGDAGIQGAMRIGILQGFVESAGGDQAALGVGAFANLEDLGQSNNVYLHLKTPLNVNEASEMFWFKISGYNYGSAKIIDETIVGYCYSAEPSIVGAVATGNFNPSSYVDSNGNVVLRILFDYVYFSTVRVDSMKVGNGRLFAVNDLTPKFSLSDKVVFPQG